MKRLLIYVLILFTSTFVLAQQGDAGSLTGYIYDENGSPLSSATVEIPKLKMKTFADEHGRYVLTHVRKGTIEILVSYNAYTEIKQSISIAPGKTTNVDFTLTPVNIIGAVTLTASLKEQVKALNQQRNSDQIVNVVSADQVGKFPDDNIGDAIKRIPGIAVQNDQGEARDLIVRGLSPQLNSVTLNGERLPSAEGDNRRVQLDLIPSDMIQTIEVRKTLTPDQEADAIGGSVNLITRNAGKKPRLTFTTGYGQNPIRNRPKYNFSGIASKRFFNNALGIVLSGSYYDTDYGSDNIEFAWDKDSNNKLYISDEQIRKYNVQRIRQSIQANLDYKINNNNKIYFKSIFNQRKDWENRYRLRFKKISSPDENGISTAEVRRQTKGGINNNENKKQRLERQKTHKLSLKGEHILFNWVQLDWKISHSKASEERPHERYISYRLKKTKVSLDLEDLKRPHVIPSNNAYNTPSELTLKDLYEEHRLTDEKKTTAKVNFNLSTEKFWKPLKYIKFGYHFNTKDKARDNDYISYSPTDDKISKMNQVGFSDQTVRHFLPGSKYQSGNFVTRTYLGNIDLYNTKSFSPERKEEEILPRNYTASENIHAGYIMFKLKPVKHLGIVGGLRMEATDTQYTGNIIEFDDKGDIASQQTKTEESRYTSILPDVSLKYSFSKNTKLRFAFTHAIARPNYYDLVPYVNIIREDSEISFGNPDLKATRSVNYDLLFDHYFSNKIGLISAGVFYKDVKDFIYDNVIDHYSDDQLNVNDFQAKTIKNGKPAKIYGFEIAFERQLDFLPSFLKNLNFYANYSYTGSEMKGIINRENEKLDLAGVVPNTFNLSLAYETKRLSIRNSFNFADAYIDKYGSESFRDRYYDQQFFWDVNASYLIGNHFRIYTDFRNLTNQPLRYYQGSSKLTAQEEFYKFNWDVGLRFNF